MRKYFIAGLIFWLPIWATVVVARFIIGLLDSSLALLPKAYQPDNLLGFHIPGLGLIFTIGVVLLTGLLVANIIGAKLLHWWEKILDRIPLVRSIHAAVKQVLHTFSQPRNSAFRKVVMIEFPRKGTWAIGFQTSETLSNLPQNDKILAVFVPTTPNPTSGFLMFTPADEVKVLDMSIEEAFKAIISIGVVMPERNLSAAGPLQD